MPRLPFSPARKRWRASTRSRSSARRRSSLSCCCPGQEEPGRRRRRQPRPRPRRTTQVRRQCEQAPYHLLFQARLLSPPSPLNRDESSSTRGCTSVLPRRSQMPNWALIKLNTNQKQSSCSSSRRCCGAGVVVASEIRPHRLPPTGAPRQARQVRPPDRGQGNVCRRPVGRGRGQDQHDDGEVRS